MYQSVLSLPARNASTSPLALSAALGVLLRTPPSPPHPDHPPDGAVCQMWYMALSVPRAKTSSRPSRLFTTPTSPVTPPPSCAQSDQLYPPAAVWKEVQMELSARVAKSCRRPSE